MDYFESCLPNEAIKKNKKPLHLHPVARNSLGKHMRLVKRYTPPRNHSGLYFRGWLVCFLIVSDTVMMNHVLVRGIECICKTGLRQAADTSPKDLPLQLSTASVMLSPAGVITGIFTWIGGLRLFWKIGSMHTGIPASGMVLCLTSAALVSLFSGLLPAGKTAQFGPLEVLCHD